MEKSILKSNMESIGDDIAMTYGGKIISKDLDKNLFIMNNHRWAFYCWQKYLTRSDTKIKIIHIDAHPDACSIDREFEEELINESNLESITDKCLKWDNFIDAFVKKNENNIEIISLVHGKYFNDCFCDEKFEYTNFDNEKDFFQAINEIKSFDIVDIDLDFFIDADKSETKYESWSEERIAEFMKLLCTQIDTPNLITISTSPSCMGGLMEDNKVLLERANTLLDIVMKNLKKYNWS